MEYINQFMENLLLARQITDLSPEVKARMIQEMRQALAEQVLTEIVTKLARDDAGTLLLKIGYEIKTGADGEANLMKMPGNAKKDLFSVLSAPENRAFLEVRGIKLDDVTKQMMTLFGQFYMEAK